ncbi:MAG: hypothetical protein ABJA50_02320 [Chloroflexota bacterium]
MTSSDDATGKGDKDTSDIEAQVTKLLRKIGWDASDMAQIEVYARMSPARKVEQMLRIRYGCVKLLKARLRREHPDLSEAALSALLQEHLDLVREDKRFAY